MSFNLLSAFGLTAQNLSAFGLNGTNAVSFFGEEAVETFVTETLSTLGSTTLPTFSGNGGEFLDSMIEVFDFTSNTATPNAGTELRSDILENMINAWQDAENTLQQSTGATFDDLTFSFDPATGVASVNIDGVGGNSINVNDLVGQAVADAGIDTSMFGL